MFNLDVFEYALNHNMGLYVCAHARAPSRKCVTTWDNV